MDRLSNEEAERCLLGSVILDRAAWAALGSTVTEEMFYLGKHGVIWSALSSLYTSGAQSDLVLLRGKMEKDGTMDSVGGPDYLLSLSDTVPTSANADYYASEVAAYAIRRWYFQAFSELSSICKDDGIDLDTVEAAVTSRLQSIAQKRPTSVQSFKSMIGSAFSDILTKSGLFDDKSIKTGYHGLDGPLNGGFQPGQLILLAARPGVGKSSLATNIALHVGCDENKPVAFFSLEVSGHEVCKAMIAARAKVCTFHVSKSNVSEEEKLRIVATAEAFSAAEFHIDDNGNHTMPSLTSTCRALHYKKPLGLIVIDYLGLINPGKAFENRQTEMAYISRCAKMLAKELKVPVLALAQLNREVEKRAEQKPTLADLRDSGALEQDADIVLTIHAKDTAKTKHALTIAKNRHGEAGKEIDMVFEKQFLKWSQGSGV